jgi:hypothetical protein
MIFYFDFKKIQLIIVFNIILILIFYIFSKRYFPIISKLIYFQNLINLILYIEFWFLSPDFNKIDNTIEFTICYIIYLQVIVSNINKWYIKFIIFIAMCEYVCLRGEKAEIRPILLVVYFLYCARVYLEEKEARNKYYYMHKEIKINENFRNLFKNVIPCSIFVCTTN